MNRTDEMSPSEEAGPVRLSDLAYRRILEALFDKRVPAGAFVSQSDLVLVTGIPVGPLRDALRVLEAEGLLTIHPRSGIQFIKPGLELTRSTYQYRSILECAAIRVYAEIADETEVQRLLEGHEKAIASIRRTSNPLDLPKKMQRLEADLHGSIILSLGNPLIEKGYQRVWNYLRLLRLDRKLTSPLALRSLQEHVEIIKACRTRDPDQAVLALQAHFAAALQRSMGMF